ncbi:MAG: hypothetical protein ACYTHM_23695 [Planctomycetota bacterium]|jgi:hypothetical protein
MTRNEAGERAIPLKEKALRQKRERRVKGLLGVWVRFAVIYLALLAIGQLSLLAIVVWSPEVQNVGQSPPLGILLLVVFPVQFVLLLAWWASPRGIRELRTAKRMNLVNTVLMVPVGLVTWFLLFAGILASAHFGNPLVCMGMLVVSFQILLLALWVFSLLQKGKMPWWFHPANGLNVLLLLALVLSIVFESTVRTWLS